MSYYLNALFLKINRLRSICSQFVVFPREGNVSRTFSIFISTTYKFWQYIFNQSWQQGLLPNSLYIAYYYSVRYSFNSIKEITIMYRTPLIFLTVIRCSRFQKSISLFRVKEKNIYLKIIYTSPYRAGASLPLRIWRYFVVYFLLIIMMQECFSWFYRFPKWILQ